MPQYSPLPLGSVRPLGWMLAQMRQDLTAGFAGCLDSLTERAATDLFRNRIGSSTEQFAWWDSETRGNWLWGYTMLAGLADLPEHQTRVARLAAELLATQDPDGYLGIYAANARYQHGDEENGELWGQSRALLTLLSYYELSGEPEYLAAVRAAVDLTMQHYGPAQRHFRTAQRSSSITGMTHGLCYVDVVEWLYEITGDERYRDFGLWLFADFSQLPSPFQNDDLTPNNLLNRRKPFEGHAVHTVEHLRALLFAVAHGDPELAAVWAAARRKLALYTLPSGAVLGDESIHGLATPDIGYEYCTLTEMLLSLSSAAQKFADREYADWLEVLAFNAAQGARLPDSRGLSYLTSDTRLYATADRPDSYSQLQDHHGRFKFSPTHEDVACCCNPNSLRLLPHYVSRMWLRSHEPHGLVAMNYGPSRLQTAINGAMVTITQTSEYPFTDEISLQVEVSQPVTFSLWLRQPAWSAAASLHGATATSAEGFWQIDQEWQGSQTITLRLPAAVTPVAYATGEYAVRRGPLQFALPAEYALQSIKTYAHDFHDYDAIPTDIAQAYAPVILDPAQPECGFSVEWRDLGGLPPNWSRPALHLRMGNAELLPLGSTVLRRAGFPLRRSPQIAVE